MSNWIEVFRPAADPSAEEIRLGDWIGLSRYGDLEGEYHTARNRIGLHDRSYRGLLEVTGADRASWLHNLTTNQIGTLQPGEGNYTFATNLKGRILFDMNVSVRPEAIWLDLDIRWLHLAQRHFDKYTIVEDVVVRDRSDEFLRLALIGAQAPALLARLGASNAAVMPFLQISRLTVDGAEIACFRHDLCGLFAADLLVPKDFAKAVWNTLRACDGVTPVGYQAVDMLRMEAGIPWPVSEINDQVLPAETGQLRRAVSFTKGCYLGQEIVERMRSRESLARKLSLLRFDGQRVPQPGDQLFADHTHVGQVSSACRSLKFGAPIALAYLRAAHAAPGTSVKLESEAGDIQGTVVPLQPED